MSEKKKLRFVPKTDAEKAKANRKKRPMKSKVSSIAKTKAEPKAKPTPIRPKVKPVRCIQPPREPRVRSFTKTKDEGILRVFVHGMLTQSWRRMAFGTAVYGAMPVTIPAWLDEKGLHVLDCYVLTKSMGSIERDLEIQSMMKGRFRKSTTYVAGMLLPLHDPEFWGPRIQRMMRLQRVLVPAWSGNCQVEPVWCWPMDVTQAKWR